MIRRAETLWLVGGLDPSGGAGVLRDAATARQLFPERPVHVVTTAFTQQGDGQPARAQPVTADQLVFQLARAPQPAAIKLGLVPACLVTALADRLPAQVSRVVDPVLGASAGGTMGAEPSALTPLFAGAIVTPNPTEARVLLGKREPSAWRADVNAQAVLCKHDLDDSAYVRDSLYTRGNTRTFVRPRQNGPDPRGTGCALATAIAARLAARCPLERAVDYAIAWLDQARRRTVDTGGQSILLQ